MHMDKKTLHMVAFALVIVGALNWGLVGLFNLNVVDALLGSYPTLETLVYALVGLSAVYEIATHQGRCTDCQEMKKK